MACVRVPTTYHPPPTTHQGFITGEQALGHPVYEQLKMRGEHKLQQSQDGGAKPAGKGAKRQYAKVDGLRIL